MLCYFNKSALVVIYFFPLHLLKFFLCSVCLAFACYYWGEFPFWYSLFSGIYAYFNLISSPYLLQENFLSWFTKQIFYAFDLGFFFYYSYIWYFHSILDFLDFLACIFVYITFFDWGSLAFYVVFNVWDSSISCILLVRLALEFTFWITKFSFPDVL